MASSLFISSATFIEGIICLIHIFSSMNVVIFSEVQHSWTSLNEVIIIHLVVSVVDFKVVNAGKNTIWKKSD